MADDRDRDGTEVAVAEFHKKIKEAFEVFDHESNNTVDVREVGTIIRSLGCCPSEGELHDLIAEVEEEEPTGYIRFEKFLPVMTEVLLERRYRPIPEDILLRAFEVLDPAKRGFLSKDELIKYMTEEGFLQSQWVSLFLRRKWKKCCLLQLIQNRIQFIIRTT
ncbi:dynein regulatory complex protein 8 isoform X2 [Bubalus kerabau]|uniref:dynein regulatory complex protein 8 isoform X2 n=1 Tax=Bubalus bubalis TaxID=89462 RepID=UPI00042CF48D|nr:dynein regulatory complex protein 8 isoform X2 [Bubalus bubalis]XP_055438060.1 dynein regulatory complex protein 8 isoform X2 [Bubalus carabanensis]